MLHDIRTKLRFRVNPKSTLFQRWIWSMNQRWQIDVESTWISRWPESRRYFNIYQCWINGECLLSSFRSSSPEVFCKTGGVKNSAKFTEKHEYQCLFFSKVFKKALLKKKLWHRCPPVNFTKFLRTTFFMEHLRWLLLPSF